jgi:WhiB family redox-sensing transcriptional regulator
VVDVPWPTELPREWVKRAACRGHQALFFDEKTAEAVAAAKALCAVCPVRLECLDRAVVHRERDGIWAGLTPTELWKLIRAAQRARSRREDVARALEVAERAG